MKSYKKIVLLLTSSVLLGSCVPLGVIEVHVNSQPNNPERVFIETKPTPAPQPSSNVPATGVTINEQTDCKVIVLPDPVIVKDLPSNIREIIQNDTDRGLILMAEQIAALKKAYIDYRTNVNIAYLEYKRSCKK